MVRPVVSGREVIDVLMRGGFAVNRQRGSHVHLTKQAPSKILHVTVPVHGRTPLNPFVLHSIARQAGCEWKAFQALFQK